MKIAVGSDHGGFDLKQEVKKVLDERGFEVEDVGCFSRESVDYPDLAVAVASLVAEGRVDEGVLVCTTGIGMSIAANRIAGVRAALCGTPALARTARTHNNANVLVLSGEALDGETGRAVVESWFDNNFEVVERHVRRLQKLESFAAQWNACSAVCAADAEAGAVLRAEAGKLDTTLNLIASENYSSLAVRQAEASVLSHKYAEGYPGKRYYNGCRFADQAEQLAIDRACELFGADHANVQPHCGSSANMAVYFALMKPGDTLVSMSLAHGGHLTHGHPVSFSGRLFRVVSYGVNRETERLDYEAVAALVREHRPRVLLAGASAYPRHFDFERLRALADEVGAYLVFDMAHVAGLVAAGCHPDPIPYCDAVTTTTHKTLRGPRSGLILCREAVARDIDRQVFPGIQGGPMMHTIAAKAVCFHEALQPGFGDYARQIVANAAAMAGTLRERGFRLVSGGTDNHLMLVDVGRRGLTGRDAANALEQAGIIANKNAVPFDERSPAVTSGIRLGTPAVTTRGMREGDAGELAGLVADVLESIGDADRIAAIGERVREMALRFPVP